MKHQGKNQRIRKPIWNASLVLGFLGALVFVISSCRHAQPQTAAHAMPPSETPTPATNTPPASTPQPQTATSDLVLAEDLATLNSRGYLKDAFFDFDKANLRDDARTALAADSQWLKRYSRVQILVEGHCDERGTEEYNLALGEKRASAVKEYLGSLGVDSAKVRTISYGKDRPFCTEGNENCWQDNRRGHFVITAK